MKKFMILFASDIHGNIKQYKKIFKKAEDYDALIFGGDLTPKDKKRRTPTEQRKFLREKFFPLCNKLSEKNKCKIYLIMGNDDFKSNMKFLIKHSKFRKNNIYYVINNKQIKLNKDYYIGGYSYVPPTPFIYKDWERIESKRYDREFVNEGFVSKNNKLIKYKLSTKTKILNDLNKIFKKNISKTIFVFHAPPYNTNLDMIKGKKHVGSIDIRKFIENKQPFLALHGHIHETVDISGKFKQIIGKTLCASSGNDHNLKYPFVLSLNIYEKNKIKRLHLL